MNLDTVDLENRLVAAAHALQQQGYTVEQLHELIDDACEDE